MIDSDVAMLAALRDSAHPLSGPDPHDALVDAVGNARLVLLGEASHGTHDFYQERAWITERLIVEKGFHAVAVEADWPDAYRVNRFVRGKGQDRDADTALSGFKRFPTWMWRNTDVLDFVRWLRVHNNGLPKDAPKVGFHGLDLYSLYTSIDELAGFTTYTGTVTAASDWGGSAERKRVRRALPGSYESLFHRLWTPRFELDLRNLGEAAGALREPRLERAIGVLYLPATERGSHYFEAILPWQFDWVIHLDLTQAVEPLERMPLWEAGEPAETYPTGL